MIGATSKLQFVEEIVGDGGNRPATLRYISIDVMYGLIFWNCVLLAWGKILPAICAGNTITIDPCLNALYRRLKPVELVMQSFSPGVIQVLNGGHDLGPAGTDRTVSIGKLSKS